MNLLSPERCEQELGFRPNARTFALQLAGDENLYRHLCDGDFVICEHGMSPQHGDLVAVLLNNENTLRSYVARDGESYLIDHQRRKLDPEETLIQGVVVRAVRNLRRKAPLKSRTP